MTLYYAICFFILGTVLGSFFNVVGYRLPKEESIISPPSHCPNCNHYLKPIELIPIISFLIQRGKCKNCHKNISWFYPLFELVSGLLFMISYLLLGFSYHLLITITFISMILIIIISDIKYLIIPDEVLIFFGILFILEIFIFNGYKVLGISLLNGLISFIFMFLLKKSGDFIFKKESMGGGDIKLMFIFGLVIGFPMSIISIFLAAIIGLPISLLVLFKKKNNVIPFGPFLGVAAIIILLTELTFNDIMNLLTYNL